MILFFQFDLFHSWAELGAPPLPQHCHVHTAMARPSGWGLCLWCWQSGQMYFELREPGFLSAALPFTYQVASENYLMPSFRNYKTGLRGNIWGFDVNLSKPWPTRKAPQDLPPDTPSSLGSFPPADRAQAQPPSPSSSKATHCQALSWLNAVSPTDLLPCFSPPHNLLPQQHGQQLLNKDAA